MAGECVVLNPDGTLTPTGHSLAECGRWWLMTPDEFPQSVLPPLTVSDGALLGSAIVGCWVAGAWVRWLRRAM